MREIVPPTDCGWAVETFRTGKILFAFFTALIGGPLIAAFLFGSWQALRVLLRL